MKQRHKVKRQSLIEKKFIFVEEYGMDVYENIHTLMEQLLL